MAKKKDRPEPIKMGAIRASTMNRRKGPRWYWRARRRGSADPVWTGWGTRAEVELVLAGLLHAGLPRSSRSRRVDVRTAGELLDAWAAFQSERHEAEQISWETLRAYRLHVRYWKSEIAEVVVGALTRAIVEDAIIQWGRAGVAPRTVQMAARILRMVMKWGHRRGHCPEVELDRLPIYVRDDEFVSCSYTPTATEAAAVVAELGEDPTFRDLIRLMAITGARVGELGAASVGSYDAATGILMISGRDEQRSKRGKVKARPFPLPASGRELVSRYTSGRSAEAPLFPDLPGNVGGAVNRRLSAACELAGVQRFTCHGLRRMVVMRLVEAGVDPKTVSKLTGHSVKTLLTHYVRPTERSLRNAIAVADLGSLEAAGEVVEFPASRSKK